MSRPTHRLERPQQIQKAVRDCADAELDDILIKVRESWHGLSRAFLVQLTAKPRAVRNDGVQLGGGRDLPLHEAWTRLDKAGHQLHPVLLSYLNPLELNLASIADFELLLTLWPKLEGVEFHRGTSLLVRDWVGVQFHLYWESPLSGRLQPELLQRLRPLWESTTPTVAQRLSPKRACCLGWSAEHTVALLETHVDTNGDTEALVEELLARKILTPSLVNNHPGLAGGVLRVAPAWLAERLLAGELTLEAPQPTIARMAASALAAWTPPMTKQNVKHLTRFVDECLAPLSDKTCAMRAAIDSLVTLIGRVPHEGNAPARATLIGRITGAYLDDAGQSRVAEVPHPRAVAGEVRNKRCARVLTYPMMLEKLLPQLTLDELTDSASPPMSSSSSKEGDDGAAPLPDSLRSSFVAWALAAIEKEQATAQLLKFLRLWLPAIGTAEHVLAVWTKAVEAANSWSFLLHSLDCIAPSLRIGPTEEAADRTARVAAGPSHEVYSFVSALLARPHQLPSHKDCALAQLCARWPMRFAHEHGVRTAIALGKLTPSERKPGRLCTRVSTKLAATAEEVNDSLQPVAELERVLAEHPKMELTKTKEEYHLMSDLVYALDPSLYCEPRVAERMSELLCAKWSDKASLQNLCNHYGERLLAACLESTKDVAPLVRFYRKCPNLGSKKGFVLERLGGLGGRSAQAWRAGRVPEYQHCTPSEREELLSILHPLLALANCVEDLEDYLHALVNGERSGGGATPGPVDLSVGDKRVTGVTASLLYDLLTDEPDKDGSSATARLWRVERLKAWRFCTPPVSVLDEDVDVEAWEAGGTIAAPPRAPGEEAAAEDNGEVATPMVARCKLYLRYGARGRAMLADAIESASPSQLHDLFLERTDEPRKVDKGFVELCSVVMAEHWKPSSYGMTISSEQVGSLIELVGWFPFAFERCANLVYANGTEEQVRAFLYNRDTVDLDALPKEFWGCVRVERCDEAALLRLAEAGVDIDLEQVDLGALGWDAQKLLLDALGSHFGPRTTCELYADHAPKVSGPLTVYLQRVFELLNELKQSQPKALIELGDGLEDEERKVAGWNTLLSRLLLKVRDRVKSGNTLHTDEQRILFEHCATPDVDGANSTVLADLIEAKHVDPNHVFALVKFVLGARGFHHKVRDSALRAMMRLDVNERDAMHRTLLKGAVLVEGSDGTYSSTLSMQVLFSLCVTQLADDVQPLVCSQLEQLSTEQWDELLGLVADANPAGGRAPHTFPRSLRAMFNERFLSRYLRDQPSRRDPRYFLLFVACTPASSVPCYLLGVLSRQVHILDMALFLPALTSMRKEEFVQALEYFAPAEWPARVEWVLERVRDAMPSSSTTTTSGSTSSGGTSGGGEGGGSGSGGSVARGVELLDAALGVLAYPAFAKALPQLLTSLLIRSRKLELLERAEVRSTFRHHLPPVTSSVKGGSTVVDKRFYDVWLTFFQESWLAGAPLEPPSELQKALQISEHCPLSRDDVTRLGVHVEAMKMLVGLAPSYALPLYGYAILKEEPPFATWLSEEELLKIPQLTPQGLKEDQHWAVCRSVLAQVAPPSALRLALALVCQSREMSDLELVASAYKGVDGFTRKQVWLPNELQHLWRLVVSAPGAEPKRFFGDAVLEMVAAVAAAGN